MWKVEYTRRFLKELSELPKEIRAQAESIVFEELLSIDPFSLGYLERMTGYPDKYKILQWGQVLKISIFALWGDGRVTGADQGK